VNIQIRCNAKLNLYLRIYGIREDGFHDLNSIMQSVHLTDILKIEDTDTGKIELECTDPEIPVDETNIAWKAASVMIEESKRELEGLKIYIEKNIPAMGGLAGGSSNAAGVLRGLNNLWKLDYEDKKLIELAAKIGSDVPFCVVGGTCLVSGRGENLEPMPLRISDASPEGAFFIVFPKITMDTPGAYGLIDKIREEIQQDLGNPIEDYQMIQEAWMGVIHSRNIPTLFYNDFETSVFEDNPDLSLIAHNVRNTAGHSLMSGSGSTIFAWFEKLSDALIASDNYQPIADEKWIIAPPAPTGIEIDTMA